MSDPYPLWFEALEARHRSELTFPQVRRGLQALSSLYVERREKIAGGAALDGAGKRAAFALYYGTLHFLLVREIVRAVGAARPPLPRLVDLGCGIGSAGAAWALEMEPRPAIEAVDRSGWAMEETRWTLSRFRLRGETRREDASCARLPRPPAGIVAAFTANELDEAGRERLLARLIEAGRLGVRVLVVETLARSPLPWWPMWAAALRAAGGREDEWRFETRVPPTVALLAKAAGLDAPRLTGRSLWLAISAKPAVDATG